MEVKITFRSEIYIQGENMKEVREKFEKLPLYSSDALLESYAAFCELESVEDAETSEDLKREFIDSYVNPVMAKSA